MSPGAKILCEIWFESLKKQTCLTEKKIVGLIFDAKEEELNELFTMIGRSCNDPLTRWLLLDEHCIEEGLYDKYGYDWRAYENS